MPLEENKAAARRFVLTAVGGHSDPTMLADDFIFWNPLAGEIGKAAVVDLAGNVARSFKGPLVMHIDGMTAEGNRVAVEAHSEGELVDGKRYANTYHFLFEFDDAGKIRRLREHLDSKHSSETLSPLLRG